MYIYIYIYSLSPTFSLKYFFYSKFCLIFLLLLLFFIKHSNNHFIIKIFYYRYLRNWIFNLITKTNSDQFGVECNLFQKCIMFRFSYIVTNFRFRISVFTFYTKSQYMRWILFRHASF